MPLMSYQCALEKASGLIYLLFFVYRGPYFCETLLERGSVEDTKFSTNKQHTLSLCETLLERVTNAAKWLSSHILL